MTLVATIVAGVLLWYLGAIILGRSTWVKQPPAKQTPVDNVYEHLEAAPKRSHKKKVR